jgi:hypothetical protein
MKSNSINILLQKVGYKLILNFILISLFVTPITIAQENISDNKPDTLNYSWERFSFSLGGFLSGLNSDIQLGSQQVGLGVTINVEDALGLETSTLVLRSEMEYHFGKRRHQTARLGYFSLFRDARKVLDSEIEIGDETFPVGTEVTSKFNLRIFKGTYDYSFYMDERVKLGVSIGLFIMPISFSTSALGLSEEVADFIAPLPVFGLGANFAITPKLYLKQSFEILYLKISTFKGSISDLNIRFEYNPWKHFGFGLGLNAYRLNLTAYNDNSAFLDFKGTVKTSYTGILFFGKYYF